MRQRHDRPHRDERAPAAQLEPPLPQDAGQVLALQAIPEDLKHTSPDEMRLRADRRRRPAPTSTVESPPTGPYHRRVG